MKKTRDKGKKVNIHINKRIYSLLLEIYEWNKDNMTFKDFISYILLNGIRTEFPVIGISYDDDNFVTYNYKYNNWKISRTYTFNGIKKTPPPQKRNR